MRVFLHEVNIWIIGLSEAYCLYQCKWPAQVNISQSTEDWTEHRTEEGWNRHPSACLLKLRCGSFPPFVWELHLFWFSGLWTWTDLYHQLSCLCLVDGWLWDLSDSIIIWTIATLTNLYTYLSLSIYVCHLLNLFLWITLANINTWGIQLLVVRSL